MGNRDRDRDREQTRGGPDSGGRESLPANQGILERLTDRLGPVGAHKVIQRRLAARREIAEKESAPRVQAAADRGTSGASGALPHLDAIQKSFGKHDVSGIKAHVDGAASEGAAAMGAEAYATGDHVAFAGAPSLHTAAHEAAHVVQQQAGVHLSGGVGQAGDRYEQHADAVADRVTRGESSEALLDSFAGSGGSANGRQAAVQRKKLWSNGNAVELVHDARVPASYVLRYVPDLNDNVYIRRDEIDKFPYAHTEPASAPPLDSPSIPLFHVTGEEHLDSISSTGLQANRGGKGGFTDDAGAMSGEKGVQSDRQSISANKVHLGARSTASSYHSGFKLLGAHDELEKKKRPAVLVQVRHENPGKREYELKPLVKQRLEQDPEIQASLAKLRAIRAVLVTHENVENSGSYDADPHEGQSPDSGTMAVRTNRDVPPSSLNVATDRGEMPLQDYHAKNTAKDGPRLTGPDTVQGPANEYELLQQFYSGVDKTAWEEEKKKKDEEKGRK